MAQHVDLVDESDRGAVLVAAAALETGLENRFREEFSAKGASAKIVDSLFDLTGPLATFSSKSKLACVLGLIPEPTLQDLDAIRRLRNDAAHSITDFDLSDAGIARRIETLRCVQPFANSFKRYEWQKPDSATSADEAVPKRKKKADVEAQLRVQGYIKYHKSILSLGVNLLLGEVKAGTELLELYSSELPKEP